MKRIWFFLISALLVFCAAGSRETVTSLDRAMVSAVGIDRSEEGLRVTLQIFRPEGAGTETRLDPAKANIFVISAEAATVGEAMSRCEDRLGEFLFIGHIQLIAIGDGVDLSDAEHLLAYFIKSKESYLGAKFACTEDAAELLETELTEGAVAAQSIVSIIERHEENSDTVSCDLLTAIGAAEGTTVIPRLRLTDAGEGEKAVSAAGAEVFVEGQRAFTLTAEDCRGLARLRRRTSQLTLSAEGRGGRAAVTLRDTGFRAELDKAGDRLSCRFEAGAEIPNDQSIELLFDRGELIRSCEERLAELTEGIIRLCRKHNADLIGLEQLVRSRYPQVWLDCGGDFRRILSLTDITVDVKVEISG